MSTTQIDVDPNITIITPDVNLPLAPQILAAVQQGGAVKVVVLPPFLTTQNPIAQIALYRAPSQFGPFAQVDLRLISDVSRKNNLFDVDPPIGRTSYYAATVIDTAEQESPQSPLVSISPSADYS